jgi:hypothetical protein
LVTTSEIAVDLAIADILPKTVSESLAEIYNFRGLIDVLFEGNIIDCPLL